MLHLVTGLYDTLFAEEKANLLVVGAEGAGKSTIAEQLRYMLAPQNNPTHRPNMAITTKGIRPTVGLNMVRVRRKAADKTSAFLGVGPTPTTDIALWDVGGQSALRSLWVNYYAQCHGVLFVVDASTLQTKGADVSRIARHLLCRPELVSAPMAILFNKWDLVVAAQEEESVVGQQHSPAVAQKLSIAKAMDAIGLVDSLLYASSVLAPTASSSSTDKRLSAAQNDAHHGLPQTAAGDAGMCGFGVKVFKCFTVSGGTGEGLLEALDWLMSQSLTHRAVADDK